jgi:hypothetical protein
MGPDEVIPKNILVSRHKVLAKIVFSKFYEKG